MTLRISGAKEKLRIIEFSPSNESPPSSQSNESTMSKTEATASQDPEIDTVQLSNLVSNPDTTSKHMIITKRLTMQEFGLQFRKAHNELVELQCQDRSLKPLMERLRRYQREFTADERHYCEKWQEVGPILGSQAIWWKEAAHPFESISIDSKEMIKVECSCGGKFQVEQLGGEECDCRALQAVTEKCQDLTDDVKYKNGVIRYLSVFARIGFCVRDRNTYHGYTRTREMQAMITAGDEAAHAGEMEADVLSHDKFPDCETRQVSVFLRLSNLCLIGKLTDSSFVTGVLHTQLPLQWLRNVPTERVSNFGQSP